MVVAKSGGGLHLAMRKWNDGYTRVGVEVAVPKYPKHLRRQKPQLKQAQTKIGLSWVVEMYGGHVYAEVVVVVDEGAIVPK